MNSCGNTTLKFTAINYGVNTVYMQHQYSMEYHSHENAITGPPNMRQ